MRQPSTTGDPFAMCHLRVGRHVPSWISGLKNSTIGRNESAPITAFDVGPALGARLADAAAAVAPPWSLPLLATATAPAPTTNTAPIEAATSIVLRRFDAAAATDCTGATRMTGRGGTA